jgi:hypothetical protein
MRTLLAACALSAGALTALALQPAEALSCVCGGETWTLELVSTTCEDCEVPTSGDLRKSDWDLRLDLGENYIDLMPVEE